MSLLLKLQPQDLTQKSSNNIKMWFS